MTESTAKARQIADWVFAARFDDQRRIVEATVPAKDGQYAVVHLQRSNGRILYRCRHFECGGNHQEACPAPMNGQVCYHCKAVLIRSAQSENAEVEFYNTQEEAQQAVQGLNNSRIIPVTVNRSQPSETLWAAFTWGKEPEPVQEAVTLNDLMREFQNLREEVKELVRPVQEPKKVNRRRQKKQKIS